MEEEEEVDIVGGEDAFMSRNEHEISCLSSGQILSCDYTVHPQWLADNADATVHWPDHFPKQSSQDEMEMVQDEVVIEEPAPIDFAWCEEIANCGGDIILEQDIPTTQEEEVFTNASNEEEIVEDPHTADLDAAHSLTDLITTAVPEPQHRTTMPAATASTSHQNSTTAAHPRSLLKRNLLIQPSGANIKSELTVGVAAAESKKPPSKFRQTLLVNRSLLRPVTAQMQQQLADGGILGGIDSTASAIIPAPIVKRILQQASSAKVLQQQLPASTMVAATAPMANNIKSSSTIPAKSVSLKPSIPRQTPSGIRTVPPQSAGGHSKKTTKTSAAASSSSSNSATPKFRQTIKVPKSDVFQNKRMRQLSKELRLRTQGIGSSNNSNTVRKTITTTKATTATNPISGSPLFDDAGGKHNNRGKTSKNGGKSGASCGTGAKRTAKKFVSLHGENITINHEAESGTFAQSEPALSAAYPHISTDLAPLQKQQTLVHRRAAAAVNYSSQTDGDESDDVNIESDSGDSSPILQRLGGIVGVQDHQVQPSLGTVVHVDLQANRQQYIGMASSVGVVSGSVPNASRQLSSQSATNITAYAPNVNHSSNTQHPHPPELAAALNSLGIPDAAIEIDPTHISALEMHFHREFFEGRPTKTPERFLKIRNYIIQAWQENRPVYVSKTMVRQGLRHCGDVNCISRIHSLLEQIGAINFACEQLQYVRPLRELSDMFAAPPARSKQLQLQLQTDAQSGDVQYLPERRQRNVKPMSMSAMAIADNNGAPDVDANYTVSHEDGRILLPSGNNNHHHNNNHNLHQQHRSLTDSSSDEEVSGGGGGGGGAGLQSAAVSHLQQPLNKRPTRHKKTVAVRPEFQLIECMRFNRRDRPAPFRVSITMSTLMCLQLHSLSARHEVMGFLGGHRDEQQRRNNNGSDGGEGLVTLRLNRYKPCATSAQSGTMCEMCPVSQVQQSANLIADGYDILGWFHSHPAFPPNPSRTDVATQANMQLQFSFDQNRPFIGFILGCVDMKFKCVYVLPGDVLHVSERTVPYELDVEIVKDCSNFSSEIADVFDVIKANCDDYSLVLKKFTTYAKVFLQRHGYGKDVLAGLNNIMA